MLLLLLMVGSFLWAFAEKWTADNIPMPYLRDAKQHVCNPEGVLSVSAVDSINTLLTLLERDKGVQAIVVTVKQLEGDDPYDFGMRLGRKYGIGSKKQRSGLIIILATEDRSYQILTGNGLEGALPDAICRRVENRVMIPALKVGNWDAAILNTVKSVDGYIRGDESLKAESTDESDAFTGFIIAIIFIGGIIILATFSSRKKCPCCGAKMKQLRTDHIRHVSSSKWVYRTLWKCPKCGHKEETFTNNNSGTRNGRTIPPIFFGGGSTSSGSSFGGGTFGGGSFGGGGSGGRF